MKKIEVKSLAEYFGAKLPASKIKDRNTRIEIVTLYTSLAAANKKISEEQEELRKGLVGDKEEDIRKYSELLQKANDEKLDEKERAKAKKEAEGMTECLRIEKDFSEGINKLFNEDYEGSVRTISLEVLYEALSDCNFAGFNGDLPIAAVEELFKNVITK